MTEESVGAPSEVRIGYIPNARGTRKAQDTDVRNGDVPTTLLIGVSVSSYNGGLHPKMNTLLFASAQRSLVPEHKIIELHKTGSSCEKCAPLPHTPSWRGVSGHEIMYLRFRC
jgi:hypothetical protein